MPPTSASERTDNRQLNDVLKLLNGIIEKDADFREQSTVLPCLARTLLHLRSTGNGFHFGPERAQKLDPCQKEIRAALANALKPEEIAVVMGQVSAAIQHFSANLQLYS